VIYNSEGLEFRGGQGIWDTHFSKDGRFLVVIWEYEKDNMSKGMLEIIETENWTSVKRIDVPGDSFSLLGAQVLISPDNNTVVAITWDGFYFYDVQSGKLLNHLWDYGQVLNKNIIIASAIYSIDGSHIYFTSTDVNPKTTGDEKLRFLNTQTYEVDYTTDARAEKIAISKSGDKITHVRDNNLLYVLNPHTKETILTIPVYTMNINSMVFSPDERYLAVNFGLEKVIHVYDLKTGKGVYQYTTVPSGYALVGLGISPDQKYIVSSSGYIFLYKFLPTTGVEDNPEQKEEIIYPNPTNGSINLNIDENYYHGSWEIMDITGRTILQGHIMPEPILQINVNSLLPQTYNLRIQKNNFVTTFKLIKM